MFFSAVQVLYTEAQTVRTRKDFGVTFFSTSPDCFADYWDAWSKTPRAIQGQSSSTWDCSDSHAEGLGWGTLCSLWSSNSTPICPRLRRHLAPVQFTWTGEALKPCRSFQHLAASAGTSLLSRSPGTFQKHQHNHQKKWKHWPRQRWSACSAAQGPPTFADHILLS